MIEALRQVEIPHYRGLILRKTFPQLSDLVDKSMNYYRRAFPGAQYNATAHVWIFPSGAKIYFGSMQYTKDRTNYQGKAYDFIGFDELTHFEWEEYSYMMSRKPAHRPRHPGLYAGHHQPPAGWATAGSRSGSSHGAPRHPHPGGIPGADARRHHPDLYPGPGVHPLSVFDNPALLANDPDYLASPGRPARGGKTGPALRQLGQLFGAGVHRVAQRPRPLPGPAMDPCGGTLRDPQTLADLAGVRLRLFQAFFGGVVRGGRGRADLPDQGALRMHRPAQ